MSQIVSHFKEAIALNTGTVQPIDDSYRGSLKNTDAHVLSVEAKEILVPYSARPFKELRCPICGRLACGGC